MEKRYRLNPDPPEVPLETEQTVESVLPIPREHPDVLLHTPDFEPKVGFLKTIGLDIMPPGRRDGKYRMKMISLLSVIDGYPYRTNFHCYYYRGRSNVAVRSTRS